jgi:hypothetical protein
VDQTICFQAFEQLLCQLFTAVFVLLLHLVTNSILFVTSKLGKQTELDHHDLHDSNKETESDYVGGWQQHCGKVATAKTVIHFFFCRKPRIMLAKPKCNISQPSMGKFGSGVHVHMQL